MSDECYLYGAILGVFGTTDDWYGPFERNARVIGSLPDNDDAPPLTKRMFALPERYGEPGFYRYQVIHFGASFSHFADDWHVWLEKFEALLRRLCWFEVHLHLNAGIGGGEHRYTWRASPDQLARMRQNPPLPPERWDFQGGPRKLSA